MRYNEVKHMPAAVHKNSREGIHNMINREDMLELTRRMTLARTSFSRIAGCYIDKDGDFEDVYKRQCWKGTGGGPGRHFIRNALHPNR